MIELKRSFSRRELLWFGPLFVLFGGLLGGMALWKFGSPGAAKWIWTISAALIGIYYLAPRFRERIFIGWMAAVFPIGWLLSHVLLSLVFYLVVFPTGLLLRLFGYDALRRRLDPAAASYWIRREARPDPRRYFRQF